jgi:hypothetical protein
MTSETWSRINRTGVVLAEQRAAAMMTAAEEFPPTEGDGTEIAAVRVQYAREGEEAERSDAVAEQAPLLMDKLGERLAFERAGTRLYEALLSKYDAYGSFEGGPSRDDLAYILGEERQHFLMLAQAMRALGADPTELTPSANLQLTASHGIGKILVDPRTTLLQCLEAVVVAELADNECWEALMGLARQAGQDELAGACEAALLTEQEHLEKVRTWLAAGHGGPVVEGEGVDDPGPEDGGNGGRRARR